MKSFKVIIILLTINGLSFGTIFGIQTKNLQNDNQLEDNFKRLKDLNKSANNNKQ